MLWPHLPNWAEFRGLSQKMQFLLASTHPGDAHPFSPSLLSGGEVAPDPHSPNTKGSPCVSLMHG